MVFMSCLCQLSAAEYMPIIYASAEANFWQDIDSLSQVTFSLYRYQLEVYTVYLYIYSRHLYMYYSTSFPGDFDREFVFIMGHCSWSDTIGPVPSIRLGASVRVRTYVIRQPPQTPAWMLIYISSGHDSEGEDHDTLCSTLVGILDLRLAWWAD